MPFHATHCSMANPLEARARSDQAGKLFVDEGILPRRAKAAVFDLDGTLLDTNDRRVESWSRACEKRGLHIDKPKYMRETGKGGTDIVDQLCSEQGVDLPADERQALVKEEGEIFKAEGLTRSGPIGVVLDIVQEARSRGLAMAVCSGGQQDVVKQALAARGLAEVFHVVVTSKDVPHAKPDPDIYLLAAERLGVDPGECVAFEDADMGLLSARAAGYLSAVDVTALRGHPESDEARSGGGGGGGGDRA